MPDRPGLERQARRRRLRDPLRGRTEFLARYPVRQAGAETILELWVPARSWTSSTRTSSARIEVVREFR